MSRWTTLHLGNPVQGAYHYQSGIPDKHSMHRPICIDLFAGAGGLSLGFEQAGFDIAASVEIDPIHAAVHAFNFPRCRTVPQSVVGLSGQEILKASGLKPHSVDVVVGGAPCQGFSLIGQRALDDPRNLLVREFVRLVSELDAKYFVFENVKGLTIGRQKQFLDELICEFADAGYELRSPWRILNAVNFGVPQHRERLFLLGARNGLDLPHYPAPLTRAPDDARSDLPSGPSCGDAIDDLPEPEDFVRLLSSDEVLTNTRARASRYAETMRCVGEAGWGLGYRRLWQRNLLTSSARTNHTRTSRRRFSATEQGTVEPVSRFYKLSRNGVSNTLRAGTDSARGAFTSPRPIHYEKNRCVTVREMARLHGFPDWFRFHVTKWHGARQIGNAVPPPLAKIVAEQIVLALGIRPSPPNLELELGDPQLLSMDMTQSARYWGVPVPIAPRMREIKSERGSPDLANSRLDSNASKNQLLKEVVQR